MGVLMSIAAWGEGVCCSLSPLPLVGSIVAHPKTRRTTLAGFPGTPPSSRVSEPPPRTQKNTTVIKSQRYLDDLLGEPPEFFLHTRATFTQPLVKLALKS